MPRTTILSSTNNESPHNKALHRRLSSAKSGALVHGMPDGNGDFAGRQGWFEAQASSFFRSGWVITGFYILILFSGIPTLSIHRVAFRMAVYMIALLSAAIGSGLLFSRNTFCAAGELDRSV